MTQPIALIVDDEPDICVFLETVLEDNGATVLTASSGEEALALAKAEKPDLMTLDLAMPGQDGIAVYEALRKEFSGLRTGRASASLLEPLADRP